MAVAAGGVLYYVSPEFRAITKTVTKTLTEATTAGTAPRTTVETPINTYRMTTSALGYYLPDHMEEGYEMHFMTA